MSEWNGNLWHIDVDEGKIAFGVKEYVEPEFRYETINVQESDRVRAELDINNNGTLNNGKIIHIDIANIIDTSDYTLVSVNGNGAARSVRLYVRQPNRTARSRRGVYKVYNQFAYVAYQQGYQNCGRLCRVG